MRSISLLLIVLTFSMAVLGAITINANEGKRTTTPTAYFVTSIGVVKITFSQPIFDDANITVQASIKLNDGTYALLWKNSNLTGPVKLIP